MKITHYRSLKWAVLLFLIICGIESVQSQQSLTKIAGWNAYVHLPDDYISSPTTKYPLIVFWPGVGEVGNDASKLLLYGPSKYIKDGWNGNVSVNGVTVKPIIISVQPTNVWPMMYLINNALDSIQKRWRVDPNKMYFTGLSHGGWIANSLVSESDANSKKLAATVAMSAVIPLFPYSQFTWFAQNGGKTWQFEGNADLRGNDKITTAMNQAVAGSGRYTLYTGGHCCWNTFYNPAWKENGESIYEWMLKQSRGTIQPPIVPPPVSNIPPVANAGSDFSISLPNNTVELKGTATDADGSISSITWTKVSALSGTISSPASANSLVTGLVEGNYIFRITVTDNSGAQSSDEITVVVNKAPVIIGNPIGNNCNGKRFKLVPGPYYINLAGKVSAGDTIVIAAGDYGFMEVFGLDGTPECPIVIINEGGQAKFEAVNIGFPSHNVKFTGTGTPGVPYGFKMTNKTVKYFGMGLRCEGPIEVDHVEISGCSMGLQLKHDNPPPGLIEHRNVVLHNLYIHDITDNEGMYIGSTNSLKDPKVKGVHIYDILIDKTTREGLQIANAQDVLVERVKILQPSLGNGPSQNHAFNMGHDVQGTARNMYIQSSPSLNVFLSGGRINFECSTIDYSYTNFPITDAIFGKNYEFDPLTWVEPYQQFTIRDLWLKNTGGVNIASLASEGALQPNIVSNIKVDGAKMTPWYWGPGASVSNVGPNISFSQGCTPPDITTMWTSNWPITSPSGGPGPLPSNILPVANAGDNITITLPVSTATLTGTATDADGTIASYAWTKVSGPAPGSIANPVQASSALNGLVAGTYTFRLTVTDNTGASASDDVVVTVNSAPPPPVFNNQLPVIVISDTIEVRFPIISAELDASFSFDPDGVVDLYNWEVLNGPSVPRIISPSSSKTVITDMKLGLYTLKLKIIDNTGAEVSKNVIVKVVNGSTRLRMTTAKIFPNPVIDNLNIIIDSDLKGKVEIKVFDLKGRTSLLKKFEKSNFSQRFIIDISHLPHGSYVIWIQEDLTAPIVRKIVH